LLLRSLGCVSDYHEVALFDIARDDFGAGAIGYAQEDAPGFGFLLRIEYPNYGRARGALSGGRELDFFCWVPHLARGQLSRLRALGVLADFLVISFCWAAHLEGGAALGRRGVWVLQFPGQS
jgi:hypothetical protein